MLAHRRPPALPENKDVEPSEKSMLSNSAIGGHSSRPLGSHPTSEAHPTSPDQHHLIKSKIRMHRQRLALGPVPRFSQHPSTDSWSSQERERKQPGAAQAMVRPERDPTKHLVHLRPAAKVNAGLRQLHEGAHIEQPGQAEAPKLGRRKEGRGGAAPRGYSKTGKDARVQGPQLRDHVTGRRDSSIYSSQSDTGSGDSRQHMLSMLSVAHSA